jgi:16S rRNA (guanine527-N7)-methyltransferase
MTGADKLDQGLNELKWPGDRAALRSYINELEIWNERLGLVSVNGPDDLVVRHVLDSLAPWSLLGELGLSTPAKAMADLGSGAGFPGIPLALTFPRATTTLVERMERRAGFLESTLLALHRTDVTVQQRTFEEVKDRFDVVTFRAVFPLEPKLVKKLKRLLNPGGIVVAYKGRREVIDGELAALGALADGAKVLAVKVPFLDEERHLVVLARAQ